jgi:hypothetical protein
MPHSEFGAYAAVAYIQVSLIWAALRFGGCYFYMQRFFQSMDRTDRRFLSTGVIPVDRYLILSTVTYGTITVLILSMLLNGELEAWAAAPIFAAIVGLDATCFARVAHQGTARTNEPLRDPFEDESASQAR